MSEEELSGRPQEPEPEDQGNERYLVQLPSQLSYRTLLDAGRAGEVAMLIQRTSGWMLLQTKSHYPPGIFRLPTGTIQPGETPRQAMERELYEESNLVGGQARRLLQLDYDIEGGRQDMSTHLYLIEAPRGELKSNDPSEAIEAWREASLRELDSIADELLRLEDQWQGWGLYRAVLHRLAARVLNSESTSTPA